jgi:chromosome segregation ATPase
LVFLVSLPVIPELTHSRRLPGTSNDDSSSPSQPSNPSATTDTSNGDPPTAEWSAVGHAATGKSGRVIHNLQEEIARLTRECSLQKSRAEEFQRSNEAYKIQQQNMNERLQNLEQVNETNLNSIARKDRQLEELRSDLQHERSKRQDAESDASQTNEMMREERENHHREQARIQEISKHHETQYEVLSSTTKRDKADFTRRINAISGQFQSISNAQKTHIHSTERLEVLADQKNREIDVLKESYEKLLAKHTAYKDVKEKEFRDTLGSAQSSNDRIDGALAKIKETESEMKWVIRLNESQVKKPASE